MGRKLFVGNLNFATTSDDLRQLFAEAGTCESATVMMDRVTGRSRGFGFVEMGDASQGQAAITAINNQEIDGRKLTVNEAKPKPAGGGGGGGRGGFGGGRGGGGGGGGRGGW